MKFPSLRDLVKFGIPATNSPSPAADKAAKRAAAEAAAEARREAVYATRARKCAAELQRVAGLMSAAEFARYGHRLNTAAKTALKQKSSSKDLRLDLSDLLPADFAARCGLPPDPTSTVAPKNWERRPYPAGLTRDDQPAASGDLIVTPEMIINAARKARGEVKPDQQIDPGRSIRPPERWHRK
jgi:hypothetical protein